MKAFPILTLAIILVATTPAFPAAPIAPAAEKSAEQTTTPKGTSSLIPDDQIQKLATLVQTDQLADAHKLAFAFTLLYPDDTRGKEWQSRLDQLAANTKPAANSTQAAASPAEPAPPKPATLEDDAIKRQVDRELRVIKLAYTDAQKLKDDKGEATEPYYQALDAILARPDPFASESPAQLPYYATRAQLALEAGDPWSGFPAVAKLNALGADKLNTDAYADLYAKLDKRGWSAREENKKQTNLENQAYKLLSVTPHKYSDQTWKLLECSGGLKIPESNKMTSGGLIQYTCEVNISQSTFVSRITLDFNKAKFRFYDGHIIAEANMVVETSGLMYPDNSKKLIKFIPGADLSTDDGLSKIKLFTTTTLP